LSNAVAPKVDFVLPYGCADSKEKFVKGFAAAWSRVMNLDRFDLA
jgi:catalase-peroxidase